MVIQRGLSTEKFQAAVTKVKLGIKVVKKMQFHTTRTVARAIDGPDKPPTKKVSRLRGLLCISIGQKLTSLEIAMISSEIVVLLGLKCLASPEEGLASGGPRTLPGGSPEDLQGGKEERAVLPGRGARLSSTRPSPVPCHAQDNVSSRKLFFNFMLLCNLFCLVFDWI